MTQQRVGEAQIALGVLEVDRIDLVWHGGRADLTGLGALSEIAQRDIRPQVAVETNQHSVRRSISVEQFGQAVMRLDLCRVGVELETERLDEAACEPVPVDVRIGGEVRV